MKIHEHRNLDIHLLWFDPIVCCFMLFLSCFVVEQNVCLIALSLCKIQGMCVCVFVCVCVYLLLVEILMALCLTLKSSCLPAIKDGNDIAMTNLYKKGKF